MKLNNKDITDLARILNKLFELEYTKDDIVAMLDGPNLRHKIDNIYYALFKPVIKYGASIVEPGKEACELEVEVVEAINERINEYFQD